MTRPSDDTVPELIGLLRRLDDAAPAELLAEVGAELRTVDAEAVRLLLVDHSQTYLERLSEDQPDRSVGSVGLRDTDEGAVFRRQQVEVVGVAGRPGAVRVLAPVTVRSQRLGVLEVLFADRPTVVALDRVAAAADLLGYVVVNAYRYTDRYERVRRSRPMSVAAEMQWGLLPAPAFSGQRLVLAGQVVPAYEVGGDNFDYSVEGDVLTVGVTDAMGHGLRASMLTGVAVNTLRNRRRAGAPPEEQVAAADAAILEQFGGAQFVTVLLARVDLASGDAVAVLAGHPVPMLVGSDTVRPVSLEPQLPLGLDQDERYVHQQFAIPAGERLVLVSDGLLEARRDGEEYGDSALVDALVRTRGDPPAEAARLILEDLQSWQGHSPRDDATLVLVDITR